MNNKFKLALVAAAAIFTASAAYAGPHHWANGNWGGPNCPYAEQGAPAGFGPGHVRHHRGPMGPGFGPGAEFRGMGFGHGAGLESPYFANLIEQAGLDSDYQKVLKIKDNLFAKRQVLNAMVANGDPAAVEKASNDFTQARRTFKEAKWILFDKLYAKYPQGLPTPASQAAMPKQAQIAINWD